MTTIFFVRHGLVVNPDKIWYGRLPGFHLGETGKEQARNAGERLRDRSVETIYSSPLERTIETSKIIGDILGIETIHKDDRLLEVLSPLQGCKEEEMAARGWNHFTQDLLSKGGESIDDIVTRLMNFFSEKAKIHKENPIIVVSHGEPMMITYLLSQGIKPSYETISTSEYPSTGSVYELMIDEGKATSIHLVRVF